MPRERRGKLADRNAKTPRNSKIEYIEVVRGTAEELPLDGCA
jgi:hypothetical protein